MNGIINVLKPPNMTSHDVVNVLRRVLKQKKVGHTGTLDPMAAGILPICIGSATRISQYLMDESKRYRCEMTLGFNTDTQDRWGKIIQSRPVEVKESDIYDVFETFIGDIKQVPPMYSAIKIQGKKLYELARAGIEVERKERAVRILQLEILKINKFSILFDVKCSKGTYVRTLCEDIGNKLNCGGFMNFLLRTESGKFNLENSCTLEELSNNSIETIEQSYLFKTDYPLSHLPRITVREDSGKYLLNGNNILLKNVQETDSFIEGNIVRLYLRDKLVALGEVKIDNEPFIDIYTVFN